MKILIANVGSSSLKCQLLEMPSETVLAKTRVERVGSAQAPFQWTDRNGESHEGQVSLKDHVAAIHFILDKLCDSNNGVLASTSDLDAVGFKPVIAANRITGCQYMDDRVLDAMKEYSDYVAALHNKICVKAIESFKSILPDTPMLGLFETTFFQEWPEYASVYGIPWEWTEKYDIRRRMGHGASHYFVNRRIAEIIGRKPQEFNAVQLHLGGSSSLTAVKSGKTIDGSGGFTMQSGVPMSVFSSDMDGYLVAFLVSRGEGTVQDVVNRMLTGGGLAGISGMGFDMRDLEEAAAKGHQRAQLAIDTYIYQIKKYMGALMLALGHTDVITITAGTGESSPSIRKRIFENTEGFGIILDDRKNEACIKKESKISSNDSKIEVWVVPTNEEIMIARECAKLLNRTPGEIGSRCNRRF